MDDDLCKRANGSGGTARVKPQAARILVEASAGTGKTYRLVEAYAELVAEHGLLPAHIVAITFTRAAARELQGRIATRLKGLPVARGEHGLMPDAPIGTFHQLCAKWLSLYGGYGSAGAPRVLEGEGEARALFVATAERTCLAAVEPLRAHVAALAAQAKQGLNDAWYGALYDALDRARSRNVAIDDAVFGAPYDAWTDGPSLQTQCAELRRTLAEAASTPGRLTAAGQAQVAQALLVVVPRAFLPVDAWAAGWLQFLQPLQPRSLNKMISKADYERLLERVERVRAELACRLLQPSYVAVSRAIWQAYGEEKRTSHCCDFADLIEQVVYRLRADAGFHAALTASVSAVLIDEAQDTDPLQRELVLRLSGQDPPPSLARGERVGTAAVFAPTSHDVADVAAELSPLRAVRWVVVGDTKQSIYGFRGTSLDTYASLAADVAQAGGTRQRLGQSFRAQAALQGGLNALGTHLFSSDYQAVQAAAVPTAFALAAGVWAHAPSAAAASVAKAADNVAYEVARCAALVKKAHGRGVPYRDMAILCRSLKGVAGTFARVFQEHSIPLAVVGQERLCATAFGQQWLSLLAWLADGRERLAMANALRSPLFAVPDDVLHALCGPEGRAAKAAEALRAGDASVVLNALPRAAAQAAQPDLTAFAQLFAAGAIVLDTHRPIAALHALQALFCVQACCQSRPTRVVEAGDLTQLERLAAKQEARGEWSARSFCLQLYRRLQAGERKESGDAAIAAQSAVTLCSVHHSKGLEWPVVFLPLLNQAKPNRTSHIAFDDQEAVVFTPVGLTGPLESARWQQAKARQAASERQEERRLLYVAATRAKERLDLILPSSHSAKKAQSFYGLLLPWLNERPQMVVPEEGEHFGAADPAAEDSEAAPPWSTRDELQAAQVALTASRPWLAAAGRDVSVSTLVTRAVGEEPQRPHKPVQPHEPTRDAAQELGTLAHEVVARVLLGPRPADVHLSSKAAFYRAGRQASGAAFANVKGALHRFFASEVGEQLLALPVDDLRVEWPLVGQQRGTHRTVTVRGRLDLLAYRAGRPWLLDFKYARRSTSAEKHQLQCDAYAWLLTQQTEGLKDVYATVVYLLEETEQCISHVVDAQRVQHIAATVRTFDAEDAN